MIFSIWVTMNCNMECSYCYEGKKNNSNMSFKTAMATVDFISNILRKESEKNCSIHFHGGEPLLNYKIIEYIIEIIKNNKDFEADFSLTTNGTILTDELITNLFEKINKLSVSIDGNAETHNKNRKYQNGQGSYDLVMHNSLKLNEKRKDITIRMTVIPDTVSNLYNNLTFLIDKGFTNLEPMIDYMNNKWTIESMQLFYKNLYDMKSHIINNPNMKISIGLLNNQPFIKKGNCSGGIKSFHIDSQGNIYPCSIVVGNDEYLCGNVYKGIKEEWKKKLKDINEIEIQQCEGCTFQLCCTAVRCKIINKVLEGSYNEPSKVICSYENIKYKLGAGVN